MPDRPLDPATFRTADLSGLSGELERVGRLAESVGRSLTRALTGAMRDGKALETVLAGLAANLADLVLAEALKPVGALAANALSGAMAGGLPIKAFAKGGVLNAPAYFPMAGGLGLAGERGAEAIMPLARGPDGRLGLAAPAAGAVQVTFNVTTPDARSFAASEAELSALLLRAVRRGTRAS
jgi:phage-related minor tail protein